MILLLLNNSLYKFFLKFVFFILTAIFLTACINVNSNNRNNCNQYEYDDKKHQWINKQGKPVFCTIVDNIKIFEFYPDLGCEYWKELHGAEQSINFTAIRIKTNYKPGALAKTYCIKEQYLQLNDSESVLLIDSGAFCLDYADKDVNTEYKFINCSSIKNKNVEKDDSETAVTGLKAAGLNTASSRD